MTDVNADELTEGDGEAKPKSKLPLILGLVLLLLGGGGGFFASYSGAIALPFGGGGGDTAEDKPAELLGVAYVSLDEMIIPLSENARARYLAFKADIEVDAADAPAFEEIKPRIVDVFNTYLRAIEESDLEAPSAAARLRAQLLRRIRVVAAPAEPRDLLITTFILK